MFCKKVMYAEKAFSWEKVPNAVRRMRENDFIFCQLLVTSANAHPLISHAFADSFFR